MPFVVTFGLSTAVVGGICGYLFGKRWKNRPVLGAVLCFVIPILGLIILWYVPPKAPGPMRPDRPEPDHWRLRPATGTCSSLGA